MTVHKSPKIRARRTQRHMQLEPPTAEEVTGSTDRAVIQGGAL
jgi:hypothetical protein